MDSLQYRVQDKQGAWSNIANVSIKTNNINDPPTDITRLLQKDDCIVGNDTIDFFWTSAFYADGDSLTYLLSVFVKEFDTTLVSIDTSYSINLSRFISSTEKISIKWYVEVTDGEETCKSKEGRFWWKLTTNLSDTKQKTIPVRYKLHQNFPNPFNPSTSIGFELPEKTSVHLSIYNVHGQKVRSLVDQDYAPGHYKIKWNGLNDHGTMVSTGIYVYRLFAVTGNQQKFVDTKKMLILK